MIYKRQNKLRERIAALQRGETLDPLDTNNPRMLMTTFSAVRQWREALRMLDRLAALASCLLARDWRESTGREHRCRIAAIREHI